MEAPITNIAIVGDKEKVPQGYKAITLCPCGHDAQLWEKVIGGEDGQRYLCYTKEEQKDGKLLEDMFVPGPSQQYLKKGYKIMKDTVEGEEPLYHKQLAYKRAPKSEVKKVIVDIIVCRSKDNISKLYTKLSKVNSLRIAFRTADYKPSDGGGGSGGGSSAVDGVASKLGRMSVGEGDKPANLDQSPPSSPTDPSSPPPVSPPVSPPHSQGSSNMVQVKTAPPLASAPPPQTSHMNPATNMTTPTPYPAPAANIAPYPPPSNISGGVGASTTPYQPSNAGLPYAINPVAAAPYGVGSMGQYQSASYSSAGYGAQPAGYGAPPPASTGGYPPPPSTDYSTNIGFNLGGGGGGGGGGAPAPYNPYHHQQPPPPSSTGGYPAAPPPQGNWGAPRPPQGSHNTYGFNI